MKNPKPTALALAALVAAAFALPGLAQAQEKVLRIGMTAGDIPRTSGQPDQGYEGNRFTGIPMYDSLTQWDLSKATEASVVIPGLALSWAVDATDRTKWVFKLRPGVKFHDLVSVSLGGVGTIANVINNTGGTANTATQQRYLVTYP